MRYDADENEGFRVPRMVKCFHLAIDIMGMTYAQADRLISAVEDVNGVLHVYWKTWPITDTQRRAFDIAWKQCKETRVVHESSQGEHLQ